MRKAKELSREVNSNPVTMLSGCTVYQKVVKSTYRCWIGPTKHQLYLERDEVLEWKYAKAYSDRYGKFIDAVYPYYYSEMLTAGCSYKLNDDQFNSVMATFTMGLTTQPFFSQPVTGRTLDYSSVQVKRHVGRYVSSLGEVPDLSEVCQWPDLYTFEKKDRTGPYFDTALDGTFEIIGGMSRQFLSYFDLHFANPDMCPSAGGPQPTL